MVQRYTILEAIETTDVKIIYGLYKAKKIECENCWIDSTLAHEVAGGLRFYSQDQEFTKRTSFTLLEDYQPVADSLLLDFDFKIYDSERFGFIIRLIEKSSAESEKPLCHFLFHPEFSEGIFFKWHNITETSGTITRNI